MKKRSLVWVDLCDGDIHPFSSFSWDDLHIIRAWAMNVVGNLFIVLVKLYCKHCNLSTSVYYRNCEIRPKRFIKFLISEIALVHRNVRLSSKISYFTIKNIIYHILALACNPCTNLSAMKIIIYSSQHGRQISTHSCIFILWMNEELFLKETTEILRKQPENFSTINF